MAAPIPELSGQDDVSTLLASFAASHPTAPAVPATRAAPAAPATRAAPVTQTAPVTDEDRNRFGTLLDHAAERGLLDPREYELRLGELASATSIDQMREIVTELPILSTPPALAAARGKRGLGRTALTGPVTAGPSGVTPRSSPWLILVVVVVLVVAALVFVAVYATHVVHSRTSGAGVPAPLGVWLSGLRS
jgi:hypothetical protein